MMTSVSPVHGFTEASGWSLYAFQGVGPDVSGLFFFPCLS